MNGNKIGNQKTIRNRLGTKLTIGLLVVAMFAIVIPVEATYNRYLASQYIEAHVYSYNPEFHDFSGVDCTNFASQVLLAGGWTETGKYSYWSDDSWYYDGYPRPLYSNTWAVVGNLYNFMSRHPERATPLTVTRPYNTRYGQGDIIQIDYHDANGNLVPDGIWDHTFVVQGVIAGGDDDLYLAAHDQDQDHKRVTTLKGEYPNARYVGWHIK